MRGNNDYFGPLYVGSSYREERMIYDTASQWITIDNMEIPNAELISNYDVGESTSAVAQYLDDAKTQPDMIDLDFGSVAFQGQKYTDNMCLVQTRNDRTDNTGKLCVRNMPFVSVSGIIGDFNANGIIGLAPHMFERSFVN